MTIGDKIKKRRLILGIQQSDLAEAVNVSKQTLYKYENNQITNIPSDKIESISKILEVTPSYLMGWDDMEYTGLGSALKEEREEQGEKLVDVAYRIGLHPNDLEQYENETENVPQFIYEKLIKEYGYSFFEFLQKYGMYDEHIPSEFDGDADRYEEFKKAVDKDALNEDPDFRRVARAMGKMDTGKRKKMMDVLEAIFEEEFEDE